jgi:folate-binding protein YgfZ
MSQTTFFVPLADHGLIHASGEDAAGFLHNLLTNDITHLAADGVRLAGLCTPKGRMIASFTIWREGGDYLLLLSADILPAILKKLSMYVLRSKVKLADITAERSLIGVVGAAMEPTAPMSSAACAGGTALRLDAARVILALPSGQPLPEMPAPGTLDDWHLAEIKAGMPRIVAATQEAFTPQMVNYELAAVGGVSFQKGCYPGQEIVARTQYLGKVKRRMYRVKLDTAFPPGTDVFTPEAGEQHCGGVVLCAPSPAGGCEALLVVQSSGAEADAVHVGKPDGPKAQLLPLPYTVD